LPHVTASAGKHDESEPSVTGALTIVGDGEPRACDRVHEMARQFMTRAEQMQSEVDRFMAVAGGKRG